MRRSKHCVFRSAQVGKIVISHCIFDLDGTLIDSHQTILLIINRLRSENFLSPLGLSEVEEILHIGGEQLVSETITESKDKNLNIDMLRRLRLLYEVEYFSQEHLFPNVLSALNDLRLKGVTMSVATKKYNLVARKIVKQLEIDRFFWKILCEGDVSFSKPDVNFAKLCVPEGLSLQRVLVIGDSATDFVMAESLGTKFLAFDNGYNRKFLQERKLSEFNQYSDLVEKISNF